MRIPKCVRWSHRQSVVLLLEASDTRQPSAFQPPAPSVGSTEALHSEEAPQVQNREQNAQHVSRWSLSEHDSSQSAERAAANHKEAV